MMQDQIKIINIKTNEVEEELKFQSLNRALELYEKMEHGKVAVLGNVDDISDITGIRTAYQDIHKIKVEEERGKLLSYYYFSIIDSDKEGNNEETPIVATIPTEYWNENEKFITTKMNKDDFIHLSPLFEEYEPMGDFLFAAPDFENEEGRLYDELLDKGLSYSGEFDEYINNNINEILKNSWTQSKQKKKQKKL